MRFLTRSASASTPLTQKPSRSTRISGSCGAPCRSSSPGRICEPVMQRHQHDHWRRNMRALCLAALGGLALSASTGLSAQTAPTAPLDLAVDTTAPNSNSAIAPLDHLTVTVWREPDMSVEDAVVDESGQLTVPLAGSVMAAGKSTASLSQEIAGKLGEYLKSPQVSVTLKQAASRRVTVAGSVMQPGVYPIDG